MGYTRRQELHCTEDELRENPSAVLYKGEILRVTSNDGKRVLREIMGDGKTPVGELVSVVDHEGVRQMISENRKRILNMEKGIDPDPFKTDSTNAYEKAVPENALPYAEIKKVYGQQAKVDGVVIPRKVVRIESYGRETRKPLDVTLISSNIDYYMTAEKLEDGSFKFNGYTCSGSSEKSSAFATINLPEDGTYCLYYTVVSNKSNANIIFSIDEEWNLSPGFYPHFNPNISDGMVDGGSHTFFILLKISSKYFLCFSKR